MDVSGQCHAATNFISRETERLAGLENQFNHFGEEIISSPYGGKTVQYGS
jgi:hypothetical protein